MTINPTYTNGGCYVKRVDVGHYEVYRPSGTAAERHGVFSFKDRPDYALQLAIAHCDKLATHTYVNGKWVKN